MSSYKIKLSGRAPETAYLEGGPRPKKKRTQVVDPGKWDDYHRRMIADMKKRESRLKSIWAEMARKQSEKARQEGYREGFDAGRAEGYEEGRSSVQPIVEKLNELIGRLSEEREKIIAGASRLVAQLAGEIAVRVIHDELKTDPDLILKQVESALTKVVDKERVIIRVNTSDLTAVKAEEKTWQTILETFGQLTIEEDPDLEPGDVVIETNSGIVDARVESQVAHMHKVLMEVMKDGV